MFTVRFGSILKKIPTEPNLSVLAPHRPSVFNKLGNRTKPNRIEIYWFGLVLFSFQFCTGTIILQTVKVLSHIATIETGKLRTKSTLKHYKSWFLIFTLSRSKIWNNKFLNQNQHGTNQNESQQKQNKHQNLQSKRF